MTLEEAQHLQRGDRVIVTFKGRSFTSEVLHINDRYPTVEVRMLPGDYTDMQLWGYSWQASMSWHVKYLTPLPT